MYDIYYSRYFKFCMQPIAASVTFKISWEPSLHFTLFPLLWKIVLLVQNLDLTDITRPEIGSAPSQEWRSVPKAFLVRVWVKDLPLPETVHLKRTQGTVLPVQKIKHMFFVLAALATNRQCRGFFFFRHYFVRVGKVVVRSYNARFFSFNTRSSSFQR